MRQEKRKQLSLELLTLKDALKLKCVDCLCGQRIDCEIDDCSLYPFRPYRKRSKVNSDRKSSEK